MTVDLRAAAAEYLGERRARGYRLADHGWLITAFLDRMAADGVTTITMADAIAFAQERPWIGRRWQATRLRVVRGFAIYVRGLDAAAAELIPAGLISAPVTRRTPYLYSTEQIVQLMTRAAALLPPLLGTSMHTLIGLLAATGLRSGEAVALNIEDLCMDQGVMKVTGKYGKERLVPLHPTTMEALADYQQVRRYRAAPTGPLLIGARGDRLNLNTARAAFRIIADDCRLPDRPGCGKPRLHDLRHAFAVNSLIEAHRQRANVDARLAALANYLGHVNPANTYWYLTASPELMAVVSDRISAHQKRGPR